jgi:protein CMS1
MPGSDSEGGVPLKVPESGKPVKSLYSKKRKREVEAAEEVKKQKKAKQRKKKKPANILDEDLNEALGVNVAFARMDAQLLADYINQRTAHYWKDMSAMELDDRFIPGR